jgi:DHA1 family bicyclomycin/chloramphenicol resistance-like MFS transporter
MTAKPRDGRGPGWRFLLVLAAVTFVGPLSLHMFFPAVPKMGAAFGVSEAIAQLTVSLPLLVMGLLTLVYGSLSDRLGRRNVLLSGLALFTVGGGIVALADTIWLLLIGRFVQAAGGACGLALARAIARDVYGADRLVKAIAYLTMAYALGPMVAVPIGGHLVHLFGWRSVVFVAAGAGGLLMLVAFLVIGETNPRELREKANEGPQTSVVRDYLILFSNLRFTAYVVQAGASSGAFFVMATGASFLMIDYLKLPASDFGLYFPLFPIGYLAGNFVASRLSGRVNVDVMVLASAILVAVAVAGQALVFQVHISPLAIFLPGTLATFAGGLGLSYAQAGAMEIAGRRAGTAAGIGVFLQMMCGAAFTQMFGLLADGTPGPFLTTTLIVGALGLTMGCIPILLTRRARRTLPAGPPSD